MTLEDNYKHKGMRKRLAELLREKGISDIAILNAVETVPRHFFFDQALVEHAYEDKAFPIGEGQTISQPYTVAFQTALLEIKKGDKVLEIGTGSGYQCCILLTLGAKVYTIEVNKNLYQKTSRMLTTMGYKANFIWGDGSEGFKVQAPYDKIIVTAGAPAVPEKLLEQLKPGGFLVIPVGDDKTQKMIRITRKNETEYMKEEFGNFKFVPLTGKYGW